MANPPDPHPGNQGDDLYFNYFTGAKERGIALRRLARKKGYKLNEYGMFKGEKRIAGRTKKEVYVRS